MSEIRTYLERNEITAYIKPLVILDKEYSGFSEIMVDVQAIKNIVSAIELLGKTLKKIELSSGTYLDLDTKYYKRFPEEIINKVWNQISIWRHGGREIFIKGNRLYVKEDDYEIVLPKRMFTDYDSKELWVKFYL